MLGDEVEASLKARLSLATGQQRWAALIAHRSGAAGCGPREAAAGAARTWNPAGLRGVSAFEAVVARERAERQLLQRIAGERR